MKYRNPCGINTAGLTMFYTNLNSADADAKSRWTHHYEGYITTRWAIIDSFKFWDRVQMLHWWNHGRSCDISDICIYVFYMYICILQVYEYGRIIFWPYHLLWYGKRQLNYILAWPNIKYILGKVFIYFLWYRQ